MLKNFLKKNTKYCLPRKEDNANDNADEQNAAKACKHNICAISRLAKVLGDVCLKKSQTGQTCRCYFDDVKKKKKNKTQTVFQNNTRINNTQKEICVQRNSRHSKKVCVCGHARRSRIASAERKRITKSTNGMIVRSHTIKQKNKQLKRQSKTNKIINSIE